MILRRRAYYTIFLLIVLSFGRGQTLPTQTSDLFAGSGVCADCHEPGGGGSNPTALTDSQGNDISPPKYWRSTMMANAARDPLWQAKVQAEISAHPQLQTIIEDKCTTCHAPMGRVEALYEGADNYTINAMLGDPLAMDGVSCTVCHQIQNQALGLPESFSGHFEITDARMIYGPYENPVAGPMNNSVNYDVSYGQHLSQSELCATCHTLFTPYVDDVGNIAGEAPEQVPYLEWLNSYYSSQGIECQTCHMRTIDETIVISNRPSTLSGRNPLHAHEFVGANIFMLKVFRDFGEELGVTSTAAQFDSTIARTMKMLTEETVSLDIDVQWSDTSDSLEIQVGIQNLSGHKFPTAYPSRRAWLELRVVNASNQVVFHSGAWDESGEIAGLDSSYEIHHDVLTNSEQVQVYQNIPMDINGNKTYTLLRIAGYLKDNRIPPIGYLSNGTAADSTRIIGQAASDPDFNRSGMTEGTGKDVVHFHLPGLNPDNTYQVVALMNYQTLAPRFATDLFSYDEQKVIEFQSYYDQMNLAPVLLDSVMRTITAVSLNTDDRSQPEMPLLIEAYPNPFNPETHIRLTLKNAGHISFTIYDIQGREIQKMLPAYYQVGVHDFLWDAKNVNGELVQSGLYLLNVEQLVAGTSTPVREQHKLVYLK